MTLKDPAYSKSLIPRLLVPRTGPSTLKDLKDNLVKPPHFSDGEIQALTWQELAKGQEAKVGGKRMALWDCKLLEVGGTQ